MRRKKSHKQIEKSEGSSIFIVIIMILLLIFSLFLFLSTVPDNDQNMVKAYPIYREEKSPEEYQDLTYATIEDALEAANIQLADMTHGNIYTIDGEHDDFIGRLFLDYFMGGEIYWELSDPDTIIYIDGYGGKILYYDHTGWTTGTLTETQILDQAEFVAEQFEEIPDDAEEPEAKLRTPITAIAVNVETNGTLTDEYDYWFVQYNRSKNGIIAEDNIRLMLNKNGDLHVYTKIWNMDLASLSTTYTVAAGEAEYTASQHAGGNSTVQESFEKIVRPNEFWSTGDFQYGTNPVSVWEVWVQDENNTLRIYHVHGTQNTIVGGGVVPCYYGGNYMEGGE